MKSRNREINIFNMSLLDILCGALGAFCFMMIVLLPYYKPDNPEDQKKQKDMDETMKQLEELKKQVQDSKLAQDMDELIKKLQQQIKELEGRVNNLTQENKQLAEKNQELDKKNKDLTNEVAQLKDENQKVTKERNRFSWRLPGIVAMACREALPADKLGYLDVFVWLPLPTDANTTQPPFDPSIQTNHAFFDGDKQVRLFSPAPTSIFLYRDIHENAKSKLYVKLMELQVHGKDKPTPVQLTAPIKVGGVLDSAFENVHVDLPEIELTPQHPWMLVGFLEVKDNKTDAMSFTPATQAEREEEWRKIGNGPTKSP